MFYDATNGFDERITTLESKSTYTEIYHQSFSKVDSNTTSSKPTFDTYDVSQISITRPPILMVYAVASVRLSNITTYSRFYSSITCAGANDTRTIEISDTSTSTNFEIYAYLHNSGKMYYYFPSISTPINRSISINFISSYDSKATFTYNVDVTVYKVI